MTTPTLRLLFAFTLLVATASIALAADPPDEDAYQPVRTTDRRLDRLVREGLLASQTFRGLVDRLRESDVIVYLECDYGVRPSGGRLTFVSAVGGYRYLHVRVSRLMSADQQIAIIGHELRHAVEIADAPDVVDAPSLATEYRRIGFVRRKVSAGLAFDSTAAIEAGYQVLRELSGPTGD